MLPCIFIVTKDDIEDDSEEEIRTPMKKYECILKSVHNAHVNNCTHYTYMSTSACPWS